MSLAVAADNIRRWREHPLQMVREIFGVEPDPWQAEALEAFPHSPRMAMKSCAGSGKTCLLAWLAWNFLLTRPHPKIGVTSITGDNLKMNLWTELSTWYTRSALLQATFTVNKTDIVANDNPTTWKLEARSWARDANPDQIGSTLRGLHGDYVMWLLDETGDYPNAILPVVENIFAGTPVEAHIVQAGNPTRLDGPLYRACVLNSEAWEVIEITADPDAPNRTTRVSVEHAREQIRQYGRDSPWVMINILGKFPPSSLNALIGPDEVREAMRRAYREYDIQTAPKVLGVDVAREGDDASSICRRQGLQMFKFITHRNITSTQGAGIVAREWSDWKADACFIDMTGGFGAGWFDQLILLGRAPIGVQFSGMANDKDRYFNKRAEMAFDLVEWIKRGGALPDSPRLLAALTTTTYAFKGDRMILEPKEDIKKRIGFSPDEMDAACFVAGTKIATPKGERDIETVQIGDEVLTPFGTSRVAKTWVNPSCALTTAEFTNGSVLVGTPNHEIFAFSHGKVKLDTVSMTMAFSPLKDRYKWLIPSALFIGARTIGFKKLAAIIHPASQFSASAFCIAAFGLRFMEISQKVTLSITRMMIGVIMTLTIWRPNSAAFILQSTWPYITLAMASRKPMQPTWAGFAILQPSGMVLQKGLNGTGKMEKRLWNLGFLANLRVAFAGLILKALCSNKGRDIARTSVIKNKAIGWLSQIREIARGVAMSLRRTGFVKPPVVLESVQTVNVSATNVYNLTLEKDNAYYANGILVFNCMTFAQPVASASVRPRRANQSAIDPNYDVFGGLESSVTSSYNPFNSK